MAHLDAAPAEAVILDSWLPDLEVREFIAEFEKLYPSVDLVTVDGVSATTAVRSPRRNEILYALRRGQDDDGAIWNSAPVIDWPEEAPKTETELKRIAPALGGVPLMANMVEGGKTPMLTAAELEVLGFALVIFPGGIVRALGQMAREYYASLAAHGTSEPFRNRMLDFTGLNDLIGTPELLAVGKRYDA